MEQKLANSGFSKTRVIILLANYFIGYIFVYPWLLKTIVLAFHLNYSQYNLLSMIVYLWMILVAVLTAFPLLKKSWQEKVRFTKLFENTILTFVALFLISGILNSFIMIITGNIESANQQSIIEAFHINPLMMTFTTLIYAPIVEEITFRGAVFRYLRQSCNFWQAALVSGLSFGFIHVMDSLIVGNFSDLIYLLTYGALGILFCYSYEKNHSIYGSMILHFINNFIGVISILISSL